MFFQVRFCILVLIAVTSVKCQDQGCDVTGCENGGTCVTTVGGSSCACPLHFTADLCQNVGFPSGLSFAAVDENELNAITATSYQDALNTGSSLFHIQSDMERDLKLSLNTKVRQYMYGADPYFRTHPTLVKCLQQVIQYAKNREGITVVISRAYVPHSELSGSTISDWYAAAGTGVILTSQSNPDTETLMKIVDASLMFCATEMFSSERRYIGLVLTSDSVQLHMSGDSVTAAHFSVDGNLDYTTAELQTHCQDKINQVLGPVREARCRNGTVLESGDTYPTGAASPESVVGSCDSDHTQTADYFNNLVVYPGSDVGITGRTLMAPRLYDVIRKLQHYVTTNTSNTESISISRLHEDTDDNLYLEGRAAHVELQSGDTSLLGLVSLFAVCSGADYVSHQGDHIYLAVKKQFTVKARDSQVTFENAATLLDVNPPQHESLIHLIGDDERFSLFDSEYQLQKPIGDYATPGLFVSASSRYMRLDPVIASCYDKLVRHDTMWNDGGLIPIAVVKAYMTRDDFEDAESPSDMEMAHLKGVAMVIRYGDVSLGNFATNNGLEFDMIRLSENAVKICGELIYDQKQQHIGVEVSAEGVYIDVRDEFWFNIHDSLLPENTTTETYAETMLVLYENAIDGRVVNPELPVRVCERDYPPQTKSVSFAYEHPQHIERRRRRREAGDEEDQGCAATRNTPFCTQTADHRQAQIEHLWVEFSRKHFYHDEDELRQALQGCFGDCGTCLLGEVYEDKTEHCSHLLHWLPFELMNDAEDSTHLYDTRSSAMKRHACLGDGKQCLFNAPLYAMLATTIEYLYRPDPTKSVEEQLYGPTDNPLPVYEILYPMFAINARGLVTVWVASKQEINNIRSPLKATMLYNKAVTHITLMVDSESVENDVTTALETMIEDWTRTGCPLYTRPAVAPYSVHVIPDESHRVARSVVEDGFSFGEDLIDKRRHFEKHWAAKVWN